MIPQTEPATNDNALGVMSLSAHPPNADSTPNPSRAGSLLWRGVQAFSGKPVLLRNDNRWDVRDGGVSAMELLRPEMSSATFTLPLSCAIYCARRLCFSAMPLIPFSFPFGDLNAWWIWSDPARVLPNKIKIQENTDMTPAPRVRIALYN